MCRTWGLIVQCSLDKTAGPDVFVADVPFASLCSQSSGFFALKGLLRTGSLFYSLAPVFGLCMCKEAIGPSSEGALLVESEKEHC